MQNRCLQKTKTYIRFIWYAYEFFFTADFSIVFVHTYIISMITLYVIVQLLP